METENYGELGLLNALELEDCQLLDSTARLMHIGVIDLTCGETLRYSSLKSTFDNKR